jgi:hypothetical protein
MKALIYIGIILLVIGFCLADSKTWIIPILTIFAGSTLIYLSTKFMKDEKVK